MASGSGSTPSDTVVFGPFELNAATRSLTLNGAPVSIGARALDLLVILTDRAGQLVSGRELLNLVWPDLMVGKANLRVHVASLRKALGDGQGGARYIVNYPGRGYMFVAPVETQANIEAQRGGEPDAPPLAAVVPRPAGRIYGRAADISAVVRQVLSRRFVTIIGAGGIGKTTVATSVAQELHGQFGRENVCFVDLADLSDPGDVLRSIAAELGCFVQGPDPRPYIIAHLGERRTLLIFDNCEHLATELVPIVETLMARASRLHLLTTSREALRADGETLYRLLPLDVPADDLLSPREMSGFPGVQLFMERAAASGLPMPVADDVAPVIAEICRRLDGVPLAIELVASRVGLYGIAATADLLGKGAELSIQGRRSARPRHRSLKAMLDWSYRHLSPMEQKVFRQLSVFVGAFTITAAHAVTCEDRGEEPAVNEAIAGLVDKCLVSVTPGGSPLLYRLLNTTRTYAAQQLARSGDEREALRRQALSCVSEFSTGPAGMSEARAPGVAGPQVNLANVRKALEWSFSREGDLAIGLHLATLACPVLLKQSMLEECQHWSRKALAALPEGDRGTRRELTLQNAFATSSLYAGGKHDEVEAAIQGGLQLAESLNSPRDQLDLLSLLSHLLTRRGDLDGAIEAGHRDLAVAEATSGPHEIGAVNLMLGASYHLAGDHAAGLRHCEIGLQLCEPRQGDLRFVGFDQNVRGYAAIARTQWLCGFQHKGIQSARFAISGVGILKHPVSFCITLMFAIPVLMWGGSHEEAEEQIGLASAYAARHSLATYQAVARFLEGDLAVMRGQAEKAVPLLEEAVLGIDANQYNIIRGAASRALAEANALLGQVQEAVAIIDEAIVRIGRTGRSMWLPDLLRAKGQILTEQPDPDLPGAEAALLEAVEVSNKQSALSWELKAALGLARIWGRQGRSRDARDLLRRVCAQFPTAPEAADLAAAEELLRELGPRRLRQI